MSLALVPVFGRDVAARPPAFSIIESSGPAASNRILEFFTAQIRNPHTRRAYAHAVKRFLEFCHSHGIRALNQITPVIVAAFVESDPGSAPTKKLHLAALRHFFDYLVTGQIIPVSPASSVRGPAYSIVEGVTPAFGIEQVRRLLGSVDTSSVVGLRDRAILAILTYTACRVGAVSKLRVKHFAPEASQWILHLHEKRSKFRKIPVRADLQGIIEAYIAAARIRPEEKDAPLFRSAVRKTRVLTQRAISPKDILRMVKRRLKDAGLPANFSCHSFRATTLTDLLEQGIPLEDVQYLAGHADARTTRLYCRAQQKVTRNIVERISI